MALYRVGGTGEILISETEQLARNEIEWNRIPK